MPAVHCVRHVPSGDMPDAVPIPTLVGDLRMCMAMTFVIKVAKHLYPRHKRLAMHHALWLASASTWLITVAAHDVHACILALGYCNHNQLFHECHASPGQCGGGWVLNPC